VSEAADAVRIAMWSGPRNISTAMMRAWENRPDTVVWDEPFYAHYLRATGIAHPLADEIIAAYETDWRRVVAAMTGPVPGGKRVFYQKHMTHHLLPGMGRDWLAGLVNCFLIRDPDRVAASYARKRDRVTADDLGFRQQAEIFDHVRAETGTVPPVLDAADVLRAPERMLGLLCEAVGVPFSGSMLAWPAGPRDSDGLWARHWYQAVERSTGFQPAPAPTEPLAEDFRPLADALRPYYDRLYPHRLGR
jgi:hypothetical protein